MTAIVLAIDLSNFASRAYHAAKVSAHGSVIGLARHRIKSMAQKLIDDTDPIRRILAVDEGESWRHRLYPEYKAGRGDKDDEWRQLMAEAPAILQAEFGFEIYASPDFEADDTLATIADQLVPYRTRTVLVTNDRDLLGIVASTGGKAGTFVLRHEQGAYRAYGPQEVQECKKVGVAPNRVALFKALSGDDSDNLPGVYGIGPVGARRLAGKFRSARHLWDNLDQVSKTERARLQEAGEAHLLLMERLCTLSCSAPVVRVGP